MAYDPYTQARTDSWTWEAQCALWQQRALHQAERAAFYKRLSEATKAGAEMQVSDKEPAL